MRPCPGHTQWSTLEADAHLPEVQEVIRQAIRGGVIRITVGPGGGIRIIPSHAEGRSDTGSHPGPPAI